MIFNSFLALLPAWLGLLAVGPSTVPQTVTRLVVQDEVVWRVPIGPRPPVRRIEWKEHKGPSCVAAATIRRAMISGSDQVDFVLADRSRVRAKFDKDCDALDFYAGFYLQPADDYLCAERDAIHSRMGMICAIHKFRRLEPKVKR